METRTVCSSAKTPVSLIHARISCCGSCAAIISRARWVQAVETILSRQRASSRCADGKSGRPLPQHAENFLKRFRLAVVIPLHLDAAFVAQVGELLARLHPFGARDHAEAAAERQHGADDRGRIRPPLEIAHERLVDLDL